MKNILPGKKTNINTILLALVALAQAVGIQMDAEAVTAFIEDFSIWVNTGIGLLAAAGVYFRGLAQS